ncbi:YncE family protein [Subtercola endophyticus]|uniref:YncE family protein n=1 Tax=Subtercola endophyticus TaxID=2895559 RepID=UPI001E43374E|nr:YncE family protein [Subtercola endophyticus]UFS57973.1 YncE family protein [Subtercola endophyticus]
MSSLLLHPVGAANADEPTAASHTLTSIELPPSGGSPSGIASDPLSHTLFIAEGTSVLAVDELTGASTRFGEGVGGGLYHLAVDPALHEVFVSREDDYEGRWVLVFTESTLSLIATIPVTGNNIAAIAVDNPRHSIVVVGQGLGAAGAATFIDERTNAVLASIAVGGEPDAVAVDDVAGTIYVANGSDDTVSIVDAVSRSVLCSLPIGTDPIGIAADPVRHRAYVSDSRASSVAVVASTRNPASGVVSFEVVSHVAIDGSPWGVAIDSSAGLAYVASSSSGKAAIVSESGGAATSVGEYIGPIASNPQHVAVDESLHSAFVVSLNSLTVSVISPTLVLAPPRGCDVSWCA